MRSNKNRYDRMQTEGEQDVIQCESIIGTEVGNYATGCEIFSMLNRIEGVSKADTFPKQGGESKKPSDEETKKPDDESGEYKHKPKLIDSKGNEALGSKGKGKLVDDEDEEEEDLSERAKLKRKKRDQELDENL
ncbi:unnamed protein product [Lactuca saligna]|uniref:Uncharacterized protein n=1 Tax=Lactuca saligna TaxID=75948 RepID=A0AA35YZ00_LACSI|nr:unnamed protein product [Lactuca saligna]